MSIKVKLWSFTKRENSTKIPAGTATEFDCVLKDDTSIVNPTIELSANNLTSYNYAQISDFGRYYFIRDIISEANGLWLIELECDTLASYKTTIGSSSEYILRAASVGDEDVIDGLYPMNAYVTTDEESWFSPFEWGSSAIRNKAYIIGVINNSTDPKFGAVTYYQLTTMQMGALLGFLLGATSYMNIDPTELSDNLTKALVNPAQYIVECYMLPFTVIDPSTQTVNIKVGWWDTTVSGIPFNPNPSVLAYDLGSKTITQAKHPDWDQDPNVYKRYLRCYPWTSYTLYAGPFGTIQIDPSAIARSASISYSVSASAFGDAQLLIMNYDGDVIYKATCNIKQNFQLAQLNNNPLGFWTGVIGTATGAAASAVAQNPAGVITSITSGIASNMENLFPKLNTAGSQYNQSEAYSLWRLVSEFHYPVDQDPVHRGYPLCQVKTINTLSGYILVSDPDIAIAGTAEENEKIKAYMAGGFYYE